MSTFFLHVTKFKRNAKNEEFGLRFGNINLNGLLWFIFDSCHFLDVCMITVQWFPYFHEVLNIFCLAEVLEFSDDLPSRFFIGSNFMPRVYTHFGVFFLFFIFLLLGPPCWTAESNAHGRRAHKPPRLGDRRTGGCSRGGGYWSWCWWTGRSLGSPELSTWWGGADAMPSGHSGQSSQGLQGASALSCSSQRWWVGSESANFRIKGAVYPNSESQRDLCVAFGNWGRGRVCKSVTFWLWGDHFLLVSLTLSALVYIIFFRGILDWSKPGMQPRCLQSLL